MALTKSRHSTIHGMNRHNYLINGGFDVWQRGTSQTTSGYGSVDRWYCGHTGGSKTASRQAFTLGQTDVPGNRTYFMRHVVVAGSAASDVCFMRQSIEDVRTLSGTTATLSFWAKADATKDVAVEFLQNFGFGGSPSADVSAIGVTRFTLSTSWQKFTVTISVPSISGKTLGTNNDHALLFHFLFSAGSSFDARTLSLGHQSGTFDIANVQLEEGSVATPFEHRPYGVELKLCQRYYERGYSELGLAGVYASGFAAISPSSYAVTKRNLPTVTLTDLLTYNLGTTSVYSIYANSVESFGAVINATAAVNTNGYTKFTWTASAEL